MPETSELHLAVALDGAGWHPAAWRSPDARPKELFSAGYWTELAREAEAGALDFLTIEDSLGPQTAGRFAGPDAHGAVSPFHVHRDPGLRERGPGRLAAASRGIP
jgi:hypothetical protein